MGKYGNKVVSGLRPVGAFQGFLLLAVSCLSVLAATAIAPNLPRMEAYFADVPNVTVLVPMSLTVPMLVVALLSTFVGALADRFGRKRLLVASLWLYLLAGTAPLWLNSLYGIIASRLLVGLSEALFMTCSTALIGDYYSSQERGKYLSLQTTFASVSGVLFFTLGGALGEHGWRLPFWIYGISVLLAPLVQYFLWEPAPATQATRMAEHEEDAPQFRPGLLAGICLLTVIGAISFMLVQIHLAYLLNDIGVDSPGKIGLTAAFFSAMVVLGTSLFRRLASTGTPVSVLLMLSFAAMGAGCLTIAYTTSYQLMLAAVFLNGVGCGLLLPSLLTWNMRELPVARRGFGIGAWNSSFFFGNFLTPLVFIGATRMLGSRQHAVEGAGWVLLLLGAACLLVRLLGRAPKSTPKTVVAHH